MGFLSASFSLTRYLVVGEAEEELWEKIPELLREFAFEEIDSSTEELGFGWVCFDNMLDNKWHTSSPFKGEYVCFSLRIDKRKIPPAVFKKYYQLAVEELKKGSEGEVYLSRGKIKEIKENIRLKLLPRILPVPSVTDVIWNFSKGILYLSSTNKSTKEIFEELFERTFKLPLSPLSPYEIGKRIESSLKIVLDKYQTYLVSGD
jgi:DNA recombination-dependent growth factor C